MKVFWWIVGVIVIAAAVVGQAWVLYIMYQVIGWFVAPFVLGALLYGYFWSKPKERPATPFYDDYPDVG